MARIAKSLDVLRSQVNTAYPNRSKSSDGWVGDPAHAARKSDHNPNASGVVQALDITHDPAHGIDAGALADTLLRNKDQRIKYIISSRRISTADWKWKVYTGTNAHTQHVHVSVVNDVAKYDDVSPWNLGVAAPTPVLHPMSAPIAGKPVLKLTPETLRKCFPRAPVAIVEAFAQHQGKLASAGILDAPQRLAYCFANLAHEVGDFTIKNLTENINYTHERAAQVWPGRYATGDAVRAKFGDGPNWQLKLMDDVYGNRMGNRPGTVDGSEFIGRGGPQITGRDGYREVGKRAGLDLENNPDLAALPENQPAIAAAFWSWKSMNRFADTNDFLGCVKAWNGGTNGLADRQAKLARILPIAKSLARGPISPAAATTTAIVVGGGAVAVNQASKKESSWGSVAMIGVVVIAIAVAAFFIVRAMRKD